MAINQLEMQQKQPKKSPLESFANAIGVVGSVADIFGKLKSPSTDKLKNVIKQTTGDLSNGD
jgi:hypothetical protein